jgi:hypothetical protein
MNWVLANRDELDDRHYTMKADPSRKYFFNLRPNVLHRLVRTYGNDFCVIIAGQEDSEDDFWAIPFDRVAHLITDDTLTKKTSRNPGRWLCQIDHGQLQVFPGTGDSPRGVTLAADVTEYYSNRGRFGHLGTS